MRLYRTAAILFLLSCSLAAAQQQIFVPTRPLGDSTNAAASTAFVQNTTTNPNVSATTSPFVVDTYGGGSNTGVTAGKFTSTDSSALSGTERYSYWIGNTSAGTGDGTIPASTFALGVSAIKQNWPTTTVPGEFGGINTVCRGGHNNAVTSGDVACYQANAGVSFSNNFVAQWEGVGGYFPGGSTTGSLFINTQMGSVKSTGLDTGSNTGMGFYTQAQNGLVGHAFAASNLCTSPKFGTCSKWLDFLNYAYDDGTHAAYNAFNVSQTGQITSGGAAASGAVTLAGVTSGTRQWSVNATATAFTFGGGALTVAEGGTGDTGTAWAAFTPTYTCGNATFTNNSSRFKTIGKTTFLQFDFTITAIGTCASPNVTFTLPNTANSSGLAGAGQEIAVTGLFGGCRVASASATATCALSGGPNWVVNDHFLGSGVYENQ